MTIVFSGFRDDTLKSQIEAAGGKVVASITKSTTHLLAKKEAKPSKKQEEAEEKGIEVLILEDFLEGHEFKQGDKKPRGRKPKAAAAAEPKSEDEEFAPVKKLAESDMSLLCKVLVALSTGQDKIAALYALDEIKSRLA